MHMGPMRGAGRDYQQAGGDAPKKPLTVIARSNGHEWVDPVEGGSVIPGVFCRKCLLMRRGDGKSSPCKGPAQLRL